jgi:hypothetical protein
LVGAIVFALALSRSRSTAMPLASSHAQPSAKLTTALWILVGGVTLFLMSVAYQSHWVGGDDVTYVGRAVDYLTGEPMDRYEPSLNSGVPVNLGFIVGTVSAFTAVVSNATGISCAALHHSVLPPLWVLSGVAASIGLLGLLLGGQRLFVPLAVLALLLLLAFGYDGHRSLSQLLFHRPLQPKSTHLLIILPLQLGTLIDLLMRPGRRSLAAAGLVAVAGYLVHPWSTVVALIWTACIALTALLWQRRSLPGLIALGVFTAVIAFAHHFGVALAIGDAIVPASLEHPLELRSGPGGFHATLGPAKTIGSYVLFRLGIIAIPWIAALALVRRELRPLPLISVIVLCVAFLEPLADALALFIPAPLLWRTRWMLPGPLNGALLVVCIFCAARIALRPLCQRDYVAFAAAAFAVAAICGFGALQRGQWLQLDGAVTRLSKLKYSTHAVAEALGGWEASPYLLAPVGKSPGALAVQLPQLQPRVRLVISRPLVIAGFFGAKEEVRRRKLVDAFYAGKLGAERFLALRREFPIDWVALDRRRSGHVRAADLISQLGWTRATKAGRYDLWRAP